MVGWGTEVILKRHCSDTILYMRNKQVLIKNKLLSIVQKDPPLPQGY